MDELAKRRWDSTTDPSKHKPIDCLKRAIDQIESGAIDPTHIIVITLDNNNKEDGMEQSVSWFQAGDQKHYGQVGMLHTVSHLFMENGYVD